MNVDDKKGKTKCGDRVDCVHARRGVWLVKVPRYLSECWERNAGQEVGKLVVKSVNGKTDLTFRSASDLQNDHDNTEASTSSAIVAALGSGNNLSLKSSNRSPAPAPVNAKDKKSNIKIPTHHSFVLSDVKDQSLTILSEDKTGLNENADLSSGNLAVEGRVVKRADCRPPRNADYMRMKIRQIEKSSQPTRYVQQMEKAEVKFKPIAVHAEMAAREKQKKEGSKSVRADKDIVRQAIFQAFEKHQYYRLIDLQKLTSQPPGFVKEILTEIAVYNTTPPHKSMWELKPEYRSYEAKEATSST